MKYFYINNVYQHTPNELLDKTNSSFGVFIIGNGQTK